ncbi:unnamed protein product [Didymodactylos carnosus]|uniref:Hedgehog protein Hint domain-containing protein n=1 Tax=Didymodactylos carnosus TaxID=1234261 RepID=A0A814WFV2_9BILA|nr:unnamed protein product [Didymodactylos carnosus]CAF3965380.1 unnamed protein product [Didymodactylos carnosus]
MAWSCTSTQRTATCFSGTSSVISLGSIVKQLKEVSVGDYVQVVDHGQLKYEHMLGFIHSEPNDLYDYLSIDVEMLNNETTVLEISSNHLVFLYNTPDPVFAGKLKIGQQLKTVYDGHIGPVSNHQLAHIMMKPYSWWLKYVGTQLKVGYSKNVNWYIQLLSQLTIKMNPNVLYDGVYEVTGFS